MSNQSNKFPVLSIGNVNPNTGTTCYDWGIYDEPWSRSKMSVTLLNTGNLVFGSGSPFAEIGETVTLIGNDSLRKLKTAKVVDHCELSRETLLTMLKKHNYDYTPIRAFAKRAPGNRKLSISYVLK